MARLLVHPHHVVLPISLPENARLHRLIVDQGVYIDEIIYGMGRVTIHLLVYGNGLIVTQRVINGCSARPVIEHAYNCAYII